MGASAGSKTASRSSTPGCSSTRSTAAPSDSALPRCRTDGCTGYRGTGSRDPSSAPSVSRSTGGSDSSTDTSMGHHDSHGVNTEAITVTTSTPHLTTSTPPPPRNKPQLPPSRERHSKIKEPPLRPEQTRPRVPSKVVVATGRTPTTPIPVSPVLVLPATLLLLLVVGLGLQHPLVGRDKHRRRDYY